MSTVQLKTEQRYCPRLLRRVHIANMAFKVVSYFLQSLIKSRDGIEMIVNAWTVVNEKRYRSRRRSRVISVL